MSLLGQAIEIVCRPQGLRRMNYEILGNTDTYLHAHIFPRYEWEPASSIGWPVWRYPEEKWTERHYQFSEESQGELKRQIAARLQILMNQAGVGV